MNPRGKWDAFLLTPIPEPSTFVLLAAGAVGLLGFAWRDGDGRRNERADSPYVGTFSSPFPPQAVLGPAFTLRCHTQAMSIGDEVHCCLFL